MNPTDVLIAEIERLEKDIDELKILLDNCDRDSITTPLGDGLIAILQEQLFDDQYQLGEKKMMLAHLMGED